jgi:hypothetical protein
MWRCFQSIGIDGEVMQQDGCGGFRDEAKLMACKSLIFLSLSTATNHSCLYDGHLQTERLEKLRYLRHDER